MRIDPAPRPGKPARELAHELAHDIVPLAPAAGAKERRAAPPGAAPDIIENATESQFVLRFDLPPHGADALATAIRAGEAHAQRRQSTGFDTADGRLAARGVFLSLCRRGSEWVQVAVATTPDCARLLVHEVDLGTRRRGIVPGLLPHLHDGSEAGAALRAAMGGAQQDPALLAVFAIDATRLQRDVRRGDGVVEVALTTGMITTDDASLPFREVELRLVSGPLSGLFAVARDWSTRHGLRLSTASNGELGARLAAGHPEGFPTTATLPEAPFADGACFLRASLDSCLMQIMANASVIGAGAPDRHVIGQLRHGLERLRTTLDELAPMAADMDDAWAPVLKRTSQELASHHAAIALRAPLIQEMRAAGLAYALETSHPREIRPPAAVMQDPDFQLTLLAILAYRHASPPPFKADHGSLKQMQRRFAHALRGCQDRVADDAADLRSNARRRRAHRHLDRLSRLASVASPLYAAHRVDPFLVRCRAAEDAFAADGEHRCGLEALDDDSDGGPGLKLARSWLAGRLADDRKACESLLRQVGKAAAFWTA